MSRQSHIVRTEDKGTVGRPRAFATNPGMSCTTDLGSWGDVSSPSPLTLIAPIDVTADAAYQRVFVSGTVNVVRAYVPDPELPPDPGPGTWNVTFHMDFDVPENTAWRSNPYFALPAYQDAVATWVEWSGINEEYYAYAYCGIVYDPPGGWTDYEELWNFVITSSSGSESVSPPQPLYNFALYATEFHGTCDVRVTLYSPHGEFENDVYITEGRYV